MMRDAAKDLFDIIIVYDIDRFSRDGSDIISETKFLKCNYGVDVIDVRGTFDTRGSHKRLLNYLKAGISEEERIHIAERNIGGRITKAKGGLPWCANLPAGRGFDKANGKWYINELGHKLYALLQRYADGEPLKQLAEEYGFSSPNVVIRNVHKSQLSGVYQAVFDAPEVEYERKPVINLVIPVPAVPQIITAQLERRVRERLTHNQLCNKEHYKKYLLTGLVKCGHCGRALICHENHGHYYYRHYTNAYTKKSCLYNSIRADLLENQVLEHLTEFYFDESAYKEAIKNALPTNDDRDALLKDIQQTETQLSEINKGISNFVRAIEQGIDPSLLLDEQDKLKAQSAAAEKRLAELKQNT